MQLLNNATYVRCIKYTSKEKKFILEKDGKYIIISITPEDEDINSLRFKFNNIYTTNFLIQVTEGNIYEFTKYVKKSYNIMLFETPHLYNTVIRPINIKKSIENTYIQNYRKILNKYMNSENVSTTAFKTTRNLFDFYKKQSIDDNTVQNEISYYLNNNNDKKKRICFNVFDNYYILIIPGMLGTYNQNYNYSYINTINDEYKFNSITDFIKKAVNYKSNIQKLFNINHKNNLADIENYSKFIYNKYLYNSYKGKNINYQCLIIAKDSKDTIYSLRDLTKEHVPLLKYAYQLMNYYINDLHDCTSDELRIHTRTFTDVYGQVYFKIEHVSIYNYYVMQEGSHDKEIDITVILNNLETYDDYYKNIIFEYNLFYVLYVDNYSRFKDYIGGLEVDDQNRRRIKHQVSIIDTDNEKSSSKIIDKCISREKKHIIYEKVTLQDLQLHNEKYCNHNCFECNKKITQIYNKKKFKIIRLLNEKLKNIYTLLCKCLSDNKLYIIVIEPTAIYDPYNEFMKSLNLKIIFDNGAFKLYTGNCITNKSYYNSYIIKSIQEINKDNYTELFQQNQDFKNIFYNYEVIPTRIYDTPIIRNQIKYHINTNISKNTDTQPLQITKLYQILFLGIKELLIKFNNLGYDMFKFFYITKNKKFIILPDIKWFDRKLDDNNIKKILEERKGSSHYTAWHNPFPEYIVEYESKNVFVLWNNAIKYKNKYYMNPINFIEVMMKYRDTCGSDNLTFNTDLLTNVYDMYCLKKDTIKDMAIKYTKAMKENNIEEYINEYNGKDITQLIVDLYYNDKMEIREDNNLKQIYKKENIIHSITFIDQRNSIEFQDIRNEVTEFLKLNYSDISTIYYIHNYPGIPTFIFHMHVVTQKIIDKNNYELFEPKYNSIRLNDFEYSLKVDPNYYSKLSYACSSSSHYIRIYVNITDHVDPILYNYPYFPTFSLKVIELDGINVIYPNQKSLNSLLDINYDTWLSDKSVKEFYGTLDNLTKKFTIMKKYIKKQISHFIEDYVNLDKNKFIEYFKGDFIGSKFELLDWKSNMTNQELNDALYDSLGLDKRMEDFARDQYLFGSLKTFYALYCQQFNEYVKCPFTFKEWMNNTNIHIVFIDKDIYDYYMAECENFSNYEFFESMWKANLGIRDFYQNFITEFKKHNTVPLSLL